MTTKQKHQAADSILSKFIAKYGYVPTIEELKSLYNQGELVLTDVEEDFMASI